MDDGMTQTQFGVYVDDRARLHLGPGLAFELSGPRQVLIAPRGASYQIAVDGDHCTKADGTPVTTAVVPCTWENRNGYEVLVVDNQTFVHDPANAVIATPGVFYSVLTRAK